ncbi:MAG TPA: lycopene cyclase family protein [Actinophytocola sp.]|uniref:lycopene cyclase family protein n=1 Tax=Actinophytocola sp. TaxID=1872138 RepID=UPI002DBF10B7|nr:lycopene cyclase family protein [Actinophytocola sp.]HEU5470386.1 lycopene cyclase family protein [Actinophytocola sp.]
MTDVLVAGAGPAGWAAAAACARHGLETVLVDPDPHARWPATYGLWADECALLPDGSRWVAAPARAFALSEHRLARDYAVLDNESVRTALAGAPVRVVRGRAVAALGGPRGVTVRLAAGGLLAAAVVVDATGARRVLSGGPAPGPRAEQTAYGVVLPDRADEAVFMDWRPAPGFGAGSFRYAVPLPGGATLVEETSLASRPGLDPARLRDRLAARGIAAGAGRIERVRIPVDLPVPAGRPGVVAFGAAAALVHPATGYSVADTFRLAPRLAGAIGAALPRGPHAALRAGRHALWPPAARAVHALRRRGLAVLLRLPPHRVPAFFELFFGLPAELQRGYLGEREDVRLTAAAMTEMFRMADRSMRVAIGRSALIV